VRLAIVALTIAVSCASFAACRQSTRAEGRKETFWRPVNTWTGRGPVQTESWPGDTGAMRIKWTTTHAEPGGTFKLTIHSAISGRPMETVVDHDGNGQGVAYFSDDPRVFFAVVDSRNLDWTFTIEEPVDVIVTPK
jgi:hypothetical protein